MEVAIFIVASVAELVKVFACLWSMVLVVSSRKGKVREGRAYPI
jgi:hypothetical protein